MPKLVSRKESISRGLKRYFTGNACVKGHIAERFSCNSICVECNKLNNKTENSKKSRRNWIINNSSKANKTKLNWLLRNKDRRVSTQRKYRLRKGRGYFNDALAKRRALKIKATPKWANKKLIKEIYLNCPDGYEVDHIIPLKGKLVCGLHVENNLQYLTQTENRKKGNKNGQNS